MTNMDFILMALEEGHLRVNCEKGIVYKRKEDVPYKAYKNRTGYLYISTSARRVFKNCKVHRIIWMAKQGRIPEGLQVNHKDCNKTNNRIGNLELCTPRENIRHGMKNSPQEYVRGEKQGLAKLTDKKVKRIRKLYAMGKYTYIALARLFDVADNTIRRVVHRKTWRHI